MYIFKTENSFGFTDEPVWEVKPDEYEGIEGVLAEGYRNISNETYSQFFELQSQGKQFRLRNLEGTTFEEIFEEYFNEPIEPIFQEATTDDYLLDMEYRISILELGGV